MASPLTVIGFNEINFDYIKYYNAQGKLPNLKTLLDKHPLTESVSESEYKLLEPWIQWVTVQTGKSYSEHQIFRLGDITDRKDLAQIFEKVESRGKKVGVVSPFNADNRLDQPAFFVPDPWTKTPASGSKLIQALSKAVHQLVNDNASEKVSKKSLLAVLQSMIKYVPPSRYTHYLKLVKDRKLPGVKAIILDSLLADVFISLKANHKPDMSWLFLNAGAHIQHHYLFNSAAYDGDLENPEWYCPKGYDPLLRVLEEYDSTVGRAIASGDRIMILTGLHQKPHRHSTYYWRLKTHEKFLQAIGLGDYTRVLPRMSRDFLVEFDTEAAASSAEDVLTSYRCEQDEKQIFEVDNRGNSLFVELVYDKNIAEDMSIVSPDHPRVDGFKNHVAFVAIKNGEHDGIGYIVSTFDNGLSKRVPLAEVHDALLAAV